jgi:hypothetical protein
LVQAAQAACAGSPLDSETTVDLRTVWTDDSKRLVLLRPYHGNREVLQRVGLHPAVMACTRSRIADEWTQGVLLGAEGVIDFFDLSSYLLDEYPASIDRGGAIVLIRLPFTTILVVLGHSFAKRGPAAFAWT